MKNIKAVTKLIKKSGWEPLIISACIAWVSALSHGFLKNNGWDTPGVVEAIFALVLSVIIYCSLLLLLYAVDRFSILNGSSEAIEVGPHYVTQKDGLSSFFHLFDAMLVRRTVLLVVCWLPVTIAVLPGVLYNDTIFQLGQYFGNSSYGVFSMHEGAAFTDHHPIFTTFVFGTVIRIGMAITGSSTAGLFGLVVLQVVITAFTFAFTCNYLEHLGVKKKAILLLLAIYALFPLFPFMANFVVKEAFFCWIYVWFILFVSDFIRTKGLSFKQRGVALSFVLACLLLALTRKTGLYLVVFTCLVFLAVYRKTILVWIISMLLPLFTCLILLPAVILPLFNVSPGSSVEILGILYQQTARYVLENPNDITSEEHDIIDELLGFDYIAERYNPATIDPLKGYGALEGVEYWPTVEQINRYLDCYIAQGVRHPTSYLRAFGALNSNWFVNASYGDAEPSVFDWAVTSNEVAIGWYEDIPHYNRPSVIKPLTQGLAQLNTLISTLPILSIFYTPAFYIIIVPLISLLLIFKGNKRYVGLLVPVFISFLFLLVSPAAGIWTEPFRYAMPFIYTTPFLLYFSLRTNQNSRNTGL